MPEEILYFLNFFKKPAFWISILFHAGLILFISFLSSPINTVLTDQYPIELSSAEVKSTEKVESIRRKENLPIAKGPSAGATVSSIQDSHSAPSTKEESEAGGEASSLPTPTEGRLVTERAILIKQPKVEFTEQARSAGVSGNVVMNLLIDQFGKVREVKVIRGPGYGLEQAASRAAYQFEFKPAKVGSENVSVRIQYIYKFNLDIH